MHTCVNHLVLQRDNSAVAISLMVLYHALPVMMIDRIFMTCRGRARPRASTSRVLHVVSVPRVYCACASMYLGTHATWILCQMRVHTHKMGASGRLRACDVSLAWQLQQ